MIKGSTKGNTFWYFSNGRFVVVGEVFYCGKETEGTLTVLPLYLGTAISGFGGGAKQVFVIEGKTTVF